MKNRLIWILGVLLLLTLAACGTEPRKYKSTKNNDNNGNNGTSNNGNNGSADCGNGVLDAGEVCDPAISEGNGICPNTCPSATDACGSFTLSGDASQCTAFCAFEPSACADGDGCCPIGCDALSDSECTNTCGNSVVEEPETCDGDCPESCDDSDSCTIDGFSGSAESCSLVCTHTIRVTCENGDGCCPAGCTPETDDDCSSTCGDGIVDPENETCDGNCPTSCNDQNACTSDLLSGSADNCSVSCVFSNISACIGGDNCCPTGCNSSVDSDCACIPASSCQQVGYECGQFNNGCFSENCGTCSGNETCVNNRCEATNDFGDACTSDSQCDDGCLTYAATGWTGGYCTRGGCTVGSCPSGSHCGFVDDESGEGVCLKTCSSNSTCTRPEYRCEDRDQQGTQECVPIATGTGAIGTACEGYDDCAGGLDGFCIRETNTFYQGYCSKACQSDAACGAGAHCMSGTCFKNCTGNGNCRSTGYSCSDEDEDNRMECLPAATGSGQIGSGCTGDWNCSGGPGGFCAAEAQFGFPGGYCVTFCDNGETCPSGSSCADTNNDGTTSVCTKDCTSSTDCRSNEQYTCQDLSGTSNSCWP